MRIFLLALVSLGAVLLNFDKVLAGSILLIFLIFFLIYRNELRAKETILFVFVFLAFLMQSYFSVKSHSSKLVDTSGREVVLTLTNPVVINGDYLKTTANLDGENVQVSYTLNSKEEKEYFKKSFYGGRLKADAEISEIADKKNFYSFDYKDYQEKHGVFKQVRIKEIKAVSTEVEGIFNNISLLRSKFIKDIDNNLLFDKSGYFQALIFGDKSSLDSSDKDMYADLGISHLLAISGLHVATLLSIVYYFLGKLGIEKSIKEKVIVLILPFYAVLAGFSPSVVRAVAMILVYIIFRRLKLSGVASLITVFLIMIFVNPYYIYDIGFQFSFFITFTLLMSSDYIKESSSRLVQAAKVSLISALASMPITIFYFYNFSYMSVLSNLVFVPYFTSVIFPLVLVSYIVFLVSSSIFNILFKPILNLIFYINDKLLDMFNYLPNKVIVAATSRYMIYFMVFLVLLSLFFLNRKKYRFFLVCFVGIASLVFASNYLGNYKIYSYELNLNGKRVHYFRNGSETLLVNTSNNYPDFLKDYRKKDREYDIMNEYYNLMDYEGIKKFDYLLLTKTSSLEIGQASNLVGKEKVGTLLILEDIAKHKNVTEVIEVANIKKIKVGIVKDSSVYDLSGIRIDNSENLRIMFEDSEYIINEEKSKK